MCPAKPSGEAHHDKTLKGVTLAANHYLTFNVEPAASSSASLAT